MGNGMTSAEVVAHLRDMAFDFNVNSPQDKALTAAADALESVTVIEVHPPTGHAQVVKIHPLLDAKVIKCSVEESGV